MTVKQLIEALEKMPPSARVMHLWDGSPRTEIEHVWLARAGCVVTADTQEPCYETEHRPTSAPNESECPNWHTPKEGEPPIR